MILLHRHGGIVAELTIRNAGGGIYHATWHDLEVFFEAAGEPQNIINAATAAIEKEASK